MIKYAKSTFAFRNRRRLATFILFALGFIFPLLVLAAALTLYFVYYRPITFTQESVTTESFTWSLEGLGVFVADATVVAVYNVKNNNYFKVGINDFSIRMWREGSNYAKDPPFHVQDIGRLEFPRRASSSVTLTFNINSKSTTEQFQKVFNDCLLDSKTPIYVEAYGFGEYLAWDQSVKETQTFIFDCSAESLLSENDIRLALSLRNSA